MEQTVTASKEMDLSKLRASSYNIYVDLPNDDETVLLVHGYSGAYDKVSREVGAWVRSREVTPAPKPLFGNWTADSFAVPEGFTPREETIAVLTRRGYLTTKTVEQEGDFFESIVNKMHEGEMKHSGLSYVIMPTYSCNLRCAYCFQDHMRTDARYSHLLRCMTKEMADKMFAVFPQLEQMQTVVGETPQNWSFTLFGGEPLLRESLPIIEYIINKAKSLRPSSFGAISNGTDLDAYEHLLGPDGISYLQITLDGPRAMHDARRIYADKSGSFDLISKNITMALEKGVEVSVRMNIDRENIASLPELSAHYISEGWTKFPNFSAYVAPVTDSEVNEGGRRHQLFNSWELTDAVGALRRQHESMSAISPVDDALKQRALQIFNSRESGLSTRTSFCGAHTGMYIFDAFGDIYACWEKTGDKNLRVGYISEDGRLVLNMLNETWRKRTVASNPTCRRCRFALHCGGGCAILAEAASGTMFSNYCDAFGKRFRGKVAEAFVDFTDGRAQDPRSVRAAAMQEFVR